MSEAWRRGGEVQLDLQHCTHHIKMEDVPYLSSFFQLTFSKHNYKGYLFMVSLD